MTNSNGKRNQMIMMSTKILNDLDEKQPLLVNQGEDMQTETEIKC